MFALELTFVVLFALSLACGGLVIDHVAMNRSNIHFLGWVTVIAVWSVTVWVGWQVFP